MCMDAMCNSRNVVHRVLHTTTHADSRNRLICKEISDAVLSYGQEATMRRRNLATSDYRLSDLDAFT